MARGGRAGRTARERPPRPRHPKGRRLRDPGAQLARVGPVRLRARARRRGRRGHLRELLRARRPLRTRALRVGRRAVRGRAAAGEGRGRRRGAAGPPPRAHVRRPAGARGGRPRVPRRRIPAPLDEAVAATRRGGPLHVHLHVGHDRPAEGLHDPPPQLLRDGRGRRRPARPQRTGRRDAPLPAARPQLRPPDAPLRAVRGVHDRVRRRSARRRAGAPEVRPDDPPERPAGLREGPHRGDFHLRARRPESSASSSTGRSASGTARARSGSRDVRFQPASRSSTGWRSGSCSRR